MGVSLKGKGRGGRKIWGGRRTEGEMEGNKRRMDKGS